MGLTGVDEALWILGFAGQLALVFVLFTRGGRKSFPWFTLFIANELAQNVALFFVYRMASPKIYFWTYWSLFIVDVLLQFGVVYEMARAVLCPTGTWVYKSRAIFLTWGSVGVAVAAILAFAIHPPGTRQLYVWPIRANAFANFTICELVAVLTWAAQRLGLRWRNWVMGLSRGLGLAISVSLAVEALHSFWGWSQHYVALDWVRIGTYDAAVFMIAVSFWEPEPARKPLAPEMRKVLDAWHDSFGYDVTTEGPPRG